jgi:hypothetical protein
LIEIWHDRRLIPGTSIDDEIERYLSDADIVLILVSPDFIASEYCYSKEMLQAMESYAHGHCLVVPVIARPVDWQRTPFGKLLALPKDGKPITTWKHRDEAYVDVIAGIRRLIESWRHMD